MRLIDADKLEAYGTTVPKDCDAESYLVGAKDVLEYIDSMPAVEAIPVEWIVNYVNSYADKQKEITEDVVYICAYIEVLGVTESMVADWRIENYGKTD